MRLTSHEIHGNGRGEWLERNVPRRPAVSARARALLPEYRRREPERTALHEAVRTKLATFFATHEVPSHVRRALRGYVDCGILAKGFVRVRCPDCREESLVAFSCNGRSFCPSCNARGRRRTLPAAVAWVADAARAGEPRRWARPLLTALASPAPPGSGSPRLACVFQLLRRPGSAPGLPTQSVRSFEEGAAAKKILRHLGLNDEPPTLDPARVDQHDLWPTGPPDDDGCEPPPADDWDQRSPDDRT